MRYDTEQQEIKVIYVDTDIFIGEKTKKHLLLPGGGGCFFLSQL